MAGDFSAAGDYLRVAVQTPAFDYAGVRTDFMVERWDEDAVRWLHRTLKLCYGAGAPEPVKSDFVRHKIKPDLITVERDCNLIVIAGWAALLGGVAGTTITNKFSATQGRIGIGTATTAASSVQTTLVGDTGSGSTTSYFALCGAAPTISTAQTPATLIFTATFGTTVANFAWNEFGTDNWNAAGVTATGLGANEVFFNRGVSAQGTKQSGQIWTATETLVFGYPANTGQVT